MPIDFIDNDRQQAEAYVEQIISLAHVTNLAFDRTVSSTSPTGINSVACLGQRPVGILILSPVVAKTFALSLLDRVKEYEEMSGHPVKTVTEMLESKKVPT